MYANDQELSAFKVLLINENLEEAKRIFTRKLDVFRNEIRTASDLILQNLPRDDFAMCLIPADVNQVKGERFSAIKATQTETACLTPEQFFYTGMNLLQYYCAS